MLKTSMDVIRSAYPNPVSGDEPYNSECSYCVGGAFLLYLENNYPEYHKLNIINNKFPFASALAFVLHKLLDMPEDYAYEIATAIVVANDDNDFDLAWEALDKALTWGAQ